MKKFISGCLALCICISVVCSCYTCAFWDVEENTSRSSAIAKMEERGYIRGFEDGSFRPDATLTRAEFVTIINKMYMYYVEADSTFSDVNPEDWFYHDVQTAVQAGYIKGMGDGRFAPDEPVTREQVCVMLNSILQIGDIYSVPDIKDEVSDWAKESVEKAVGIYLFTLEAGGRFRGTEPITRGEVCVALEKCILDIDFEERFEPFNLEKIAADELTRRLEEIVNCMETVIVPTYTDENVVKVANMVVDSMKAYLADSDFDYVTAAKDTYEVYRKFNGTQAKMFKEPIYTNIEVQDLAILYDFFYTPELDFIK